MSQPGRVLVLVLAAACALVLCLWALAGQALHGHEAELAAQRDGYLLRHLRSAAAQSLAGSAQQRGHAEPLGAVLEREQAAFDGIVAIDVFNLSGHVLHSTDAVSRGTEVPDSWRAVVTQDGIWQARSAGQRQIGLRFSDGQGQAAGGVVVTLSTAPPGIAGPEQWYGETLHRLHWLAAALLAGLAALSATHLGLRRMGRPYADAAQLLLQGAQAPGRRSVTPLAQAALRTRQAWQQEQQRSRQALHQLEALDHEA